MTWHNVQELERGAISKLEVGHNINPTVKTMARYARGIGVAITWNFLPVEAEV